MGKRREPRLLKCKVLNAPKNEREQKNYDNLIFGALAKAICNSYEPEQVDRLIEQLEDR